MPTAAGERFYRHSITILRSVNAAELEIAEMSETVGGLVRAGLIPSVVRQDLSVDVPLPYDVTLSGHYGWSQFDSTLDNYQDWKVAVSRDFYGFGFELAYVDTSSIDKSVNCGNVTFKCDGTAVFTVSISLLKMADGF